MKALSQSKDSVGYLYPVLVDSDGKVLDGNHRRKIDSQWPSKTLDWVRTERDRTLVRIHANHHRRRIDFEERRDDFIELAKILRKNGVKRPHIVSSIAQATGYSSDTIERELPKKYQRKDSRRNSADAELSHESHNSDFRESDLPESSIDLILTDPPYGQQYLQLWDSLGMLAARVLKPGGWLVAYSGQYYLPIVLQLLSTHLGYYWTLALTFTLSETKRIWHRGINNQWKPIVIYGKEPFSQIQTSDLILGGGRIKSEHEWAQNVAEARQLIEIFTKPGATVLDPMAGTGTIAEAALFSRRRPVSYEKDPETFKILQARIQ